MPYPGVIHFDPVNVTKKHTNQATWKRVALVMFEGDVAEYYAWFVEKRYGLKLNKPLRGAHISFLNDSLNDMKIGLQLAQDDAVEQVWHQVKSKWDGQAVDIILDVDARSDAKHWWLNVADRELLHAIRAELGLGRPFYGLHMSMGYANERNLEHSKYIINLCALGTEYH